VKVLNFTVNLTKDGIAKLSWTNRVSLLILYTNILLRL